MGYPQKLLSDGETIQFEMKPHWRALIVPVIVLAALAFGGTWLFFWTDNQILRWVILAAALFILVWRVILPFLRWATTQFVFTNRRVIVRRGLLTKQGRDMPLSKVNNVSFSVPLMGRVLNYGRLVIQSAGEDSDLDIDDVPNVEEIQRDVYRLFEEDDARRRRTSAEHGGDPVPPTDGT
jgi:membrane protein YdbS with pleckstrin-like domain